MSKKYGISVQTLKLIQKKKSAIDQSFAITEANEQNDNKTKETLEFVNLQEVIRQQFLSKQKNSLYLSDIVSSIASTRQGGQFFNRQQIHNMVLKLATLVPEFIEVKNVIIKGKSQKLVKNNGRGLTSH